MDKNNLNQIQVREKIVFVQPPLILKMEKGSQTLNYYQELNSSIAKRDMSTQTNFETKISGSRIQNSNNEDICPLCGQIPHLQPDDIIFIRKVLKNDYLQNIEDFLENVSFSSTTISNLVNDLLDLAKMESNNFQFNEDYFDLVTSIKHSIEQ